MQGEGRCGTHIGSSTQERPKEGGQPLIFSFRSGRNTTAGGSSRSTAVIEKSIFAWKVFKNSSAVDLNVKKMLGWLEAILCK